MKKNISKKILFISFLALLLPVGCAKKGNNNPNGVDIAKILLANERLSDDDLSGNIFTSGKKAFNQIKNAVEKYNQKAKANNIKYSFNKSGNRYTWNNAPSYSNFLSYFYSYSANIEHNATRGSSLIDFTKSSIQTIDKWIKIDSNNEMLLTVDKDSETIMSRSKNQYEICRRYQNDLGQNTFEMFIANSETNSQSRMTYIPNLRYEYTSIQDDVLLVIIANKDKGYWDIMSTDYNSSLIDKSMTFSNFVMKDEAIYETSYSLSQYDDFIDDYYGPIKLISSDGQNDLLSIDSNYVSIYTTGINNLDCFYIDVEDSEIGNASTVENREDYKILYIGEGDEKSYFTDDNSEVIAKFATGKELKKGDILYQNDITVEGTCINPIGDIDFYGEITLSFVNDEIDFITDSLKKLMDDYDFTFKDNYEVIKNALRFAKQDSLDFSEYYLWQGSHINNFTDIDKSIQIEKDLIESFANLYTNYKDNPVINNSNQWSIDDSYNFANLNIISKGDISNSDSEINISNIVVEMENTSLLSNNTDYQICFAFAKEQDNKYSNLYTLDFDNPITKEYVYDSLSNSKKFELSQNATIRIPFLEEGSYVLVAYIATADDGIRVSNPISIGGSIKENTKMGEGLINVLANGEDNKICLTSIKTATINIYLENTYDYEELYLLLESYAYKYGTTSGDNIEKDNNSNWESIDSNSVIEEGTYRLKYYNNSFETDSYIIASIV